MPTRPTPVSLSTVRTVSQAVTAAHTITYLAPEAAQEAAKLGVTDRQAAYFAFRSAALGPVPWQVTLATFYNFSPRAVRSMEGVWDAAPPRDWQAARFTVVDRVLRRTGVDLQPEQILRARSLIDQVTDQADHAGKPLAAANASLALPTDPLIALWQQITVLREWRGDAHIAVLVHHDLGPCDCTVLQGATGRLSTELLRKTRRWSNEQWADATARLEARGWLDATGAATPAGIAAREQIEVETDQLCARLWTPIGSEGADLLAHLIAPFRTTPSAIEQPSPSRPGS